MWKIRLISFLNRVGPSPKKFYGERGALRNLSRGAAPAINLSWKFRASKKGGELLPLVG